jgi:hypothetical protein
MSNRLPSIPRSFWAALALCAVIVSVAGHASPVRAEDEAAEKEFRDAIRQYLTLQGSVDQMGVSVAYGAANEALMAFSQSGVEVTEPMQNIVLEQALESYGKQFGDVEFLTNLWSPIYAEHYSVEEIRALIAFYESPVGKKSLELFGPINEAGMAAVQKSAVAIAPGFQLGVTAKLEAAGIAITPDP